MVTRRSAKSKGSQFEMDCKYSLSFKYSDILRLGSEGFHQKFDLYSEKCYKKFECKRLKGISWNQLKKLYRKLYETNAKGEPFILFQSNFQPCLVFYKENLSYVIKEFKEVFEVPFLKHPSTRK